MEEIRVLTSSMDSSIRFRPCSHHHHICRHSHHHHHHHHRHHHPFCPHHHCNNIVPLPLQYPQYNYYPASQIDLNLHLQRISYSHCPASIPRLAEEEPKQNELDNKDEEEDDDDEPIFVLTDEWREFFAKSEAKRKLEKRQAKKMGRHSRNGKTWDTPLS